MGELTSAQGAFIVTLDRSGEALALIRSQPWGANTRRDNDRRLITPAPEGESGALNLFLVRAGFTPQSIAPHTRDLEEVFIRMTNTASDENGKGDVE